MTANKPKRPGTRDRQRPFVATGASLTRAVTDLSKAAARAEAKARDRSTVVVDLIVGENVVRHGLGRAPTGAQVTPTVADATFAWALTATTVSLMSITVVGVAQPGATVESF